MNTYEELSLEIMTINTSCIGNKTWSISGPMTDKQVCRLVSRIKKGTTTPYYIFGFFQDGSRAHHCTFSGIGIKGK